MSVRGGGRERLPLARVPLAALASLLILGANSLFAAWSGELRLTYDAAVSGTCVNNGWAETSDPTGRIHVVWQDYRTGGVSQIFYKVFAPGVGWSADTQLTTTGREDIYPSVACDAAGNLYVVWQGRDVSNVRQIYARRRDVASGWQSVAQLTSSSYAHYNPSVATGRGDTAYAVWWGNEPSSPSTYQVYYSVRTAAGWSALSSLFPSANTQRYPSVAVDRSGSVHTVWRMVVGSDEQIFYRRFASGAWGDTERISNTSTAKLPPSVAVDRLGEVHVVWPEYDGTSCSQVYYGRRSSSWAVEALTSTLNNKVYPSVAADSLNQVHAVWSGRDSSTQATEQVYYRLRTRTGGWQAQQRLTTASSGSRERASVRCLRDGDPVAVWSDSRDGNFEIYFAGPSTADAAVVSIIAPSAVVDSNSTQTPQAVIRNNGSQAANVNVTFRISTGYSDTRTTNVPVDSSRTVSFNNWLPTNRGNYTMRCSTYLVGDVNPANDTLGAPVRVRVTDAASVRVVKPSSWATIDSGTVVACTALVRNQGTDQVSFPVTMRIAGWSNTRNVSNLAAGDSLRVGFTNWTALPRGRDSVRCTTALSGDQVAGNNRVIDSVFVRVSDVGTSWISRPSSGGTYNLNTWIPCTAYVYNYGNTAQTFYARMFIRDTSVTRRELYRDSTQVVSLAPSSGRYVGFSSWHADTIANGLTARCTTGLAGDVRSVNDFYANYFNVVGHDVTCYWIPYPPSGAVYDSGAAVPCTSYVWNRGGEAETFMAKFRIYIGGTSYFRDSTSLTLPGGSSTKLGFGLWTAQPRGVYSARCSTCLGDDNNANNAYTTTNITVRVRDVGVASIGAPAATIDSGPVVVPVCTTYNYGSSTEGYTVRCRIGAVYNRTATVVGHLTGTKRAVVFPAAPDLPRGGPFAVTCSTELLDAQPANNRCQGTVTVRVREAGVTGIQAPVGVLDSGATLTPSVKVRNSGTTTETYRVTLTIGSLTQFLDMTHDTLRRDTVVRFPSWTALVRGWNIVKCSLGFAADANPANNVRIDSVFVSVHNAAGVAIVAPTGSLVERTHVVPTPVVANRGTGSESFQVKFEVRSPSLGTVYSESLPINLQPGRQDTLRDLLPEWLATPDGDYLAWARVILAGDQRPDDDSVVTPFTVTDVLSHDVGPTSIIQPPNRLAMGVLTPRLVVANHGEGTETFHVFFRIASELTSYFDSVPVAALAPGESVTLTFSEWSARPGSYLARCSTALAGDANPGNDTLSRAVTVDSLAPGGWTEQAQMPPGVKNKKVKSGGSLAYRAPDEIYALKGNNTCEFYLYSPASGWTTRESVPVRVEKKKRPKKGAALAYSPRDDKLYLLKGNGTTEFWCFDPVLRIWSPKSDIPRGAKALKGGSGLCYSSADSSLYALKGSKTLEFYRYDPGRDTWTTAPQVPSGPASKTVGDGGAVAADGAGSVYALKGNNTPEFYAYRVSAGYWTTLDGLPAGLKRKKVKDGAALAADDGTTVYALKGNNRTEFYSYDALLGYWAVRQELPLGTSVKRVKSGGALVSAAGGVYALKGNNTLEFWLYTSGKGFVLSPNPAKMAAQGGSFQSQGAAIGLYPNPVADFVTLQSRAPVAGTVTLYDIGGRRLRQCAVNRAVSTRLDLRDLPAGVYLLELHTALGKTTQKLIVER